MEKKGFGSRREERRREAEERYRAEMKYRKKIMGEQERWAEKYQEFPEFKSFFQKMVIWQYVLYYMGFVVMIGSIFSIGTFARDSVGISSFLPVVVWLGLVAYFKYPAKAPYGLLVLMAVVVAFNLLPFWYGGFNDSSFGGVLAGAGVLLQKLGVSLPTAMEDYTLYILRRHGLGFVAQGVAVTSFYLLTAVFLVKLSLPGSREIFRLMDRIGLASGQESQEERQMEALSERRPADVEDAEKGERRKRRVSEAKKFMEIYEAHPDIGRYMQKRCSSIREQIFFGTILHGGWICAAAWRMPARTWIFSLAGFVLISAAMYACMSEKPERAYIFLGAVTSVIVVNLLPFVHRLVGDTVVYYGFSSFYVRRSLNFLACIFYLWTFAMAVKMARPKEMKMVKRLKELSDNWQKTEVEP